MPDLSEGPAVAEGPGVEMQYGLRWNPNPPVTVPQLVTIALAAGVYTILAWIAVNALPFQVPGVSALFIAMGFGVPFTIWFGGWGLVIGFIGTAVGAGILSGLPLPVSVFFGIGDIILFGSLHLLYRGLAPRFGVDPIARDVFTGRGFLYFWIIAAIVPHILCAMYSIGLLYLVGFVPQDLIVVTFFGFWISNMFLVIIISPILLKLLTPVVERQGLTSYGWWT
jgi:hypothetical protein